MGKRLFFLFVVFIGVSVGRVFAADKIEFKASAPSAVIMGQSFQLSFTANDEIKDLRMQELADFDILYGPAPSENHSMMILNGKRQSSNSYTFTYTLMPKKVGTFKIPPVTAKIDGANYTSNALEIKVLPQDEKPANNDAAQSSNNGITSDGLFLRMTCSKTNVYEQEGLLVTFKLYSLYDVQPTNINFPEFEGFLAQEIKLPNPQWTLENYNGRNYQSVVFRQYILYPQHSGKIEIKPGSMDVEIRVRNQSRVRDPFRDFFDTYRTVNKTIKTAGATINVKALPAGKPASFSGAVGNYSLTSEINATNVKANDAVTVKLNIKGNGNLKLIKNPEVKFPNDFEIYDPKIESNTETTVNGTSGTKTIEYMAIPRYEGDFDIPAVEFSFFDPKDGKYKTLKSDAYKLHVEKGEGGNNASSPVVNNFTNKEAVKYLGQDIRYLKVKTPQFIQTNNLFYGSLMYALGYIIPAIVFIVFFVIYRKQIKENANIALVRTKKANKVASRRLKQAGRLLSEGKKEAFYDEVLRALWGYLSDKLNIPVANLTKDNVEAELDKYGISPELSKTFMDILKECEFARYAPVQGTGAMDKLYKETVSVIEQMENTIKK